MAIQVDLQDSNFGVPFAGAYFRIATAAISRTRDAGNRFSVMLDVVGYATQPQNEDTKDVDFRRYYAPMADIESQTGDSFIAKCYAWVMAQPDMAGCQAV